MKRIKKAEIIAYLEDKSYCHHYDYWPISWNIKVNERWPSDGRVDKDGEPLNLSMTIDANGKPTKHFNDPQFDDLWEMHTSNNHDLFWDMCEEWLRFAGDNPWCDFFYGVEDPAIQAASDAGVKFGIAGRSGGYLVLDGFNGDRLCFADTGDRYDWDKVWDYNDLWTLYKACHIVDDLVDNRHESLAYLYADFRHQKEAEWATIPELPICEECEKPINYGVVNDSHIKDHFCQCDKPTIPRASHFYCSTEDCVGQAINIISLEHGSRKYTCGRCSAAIIEVNRRGPIKKIIPIEDIR